MQNISEFTKVKNYSFLKCRIIADDEDDITTGKKINLIKQENYLNNYLK